MEERRFYSKKQYLRLMLEKRMTVFRRFALLFLLPSLICGQTLVAPLGGFYRYIYEDGREATLMEYFSSEVEPFSIHLEMMENTCSNNNLPPSYIMNIPLERRSVAYIWTKHPRKVGGHAANRYGNGEMTYSLIISAFHRFLWNQLGFDPLGTGQEVTLRPSERQDREEIEVQSISFQADVENKQLLIAGMRVTTQLVFRAVGVRLVLDDEGNYRLTEPEIFGVNRNLNILERLSRMNSVEFVFKENSSLCRAVFLATPSRWQGRLFARDSYLIHVQDLPDARAFKEEMAPVIVDKEGDPHQRFYLEIFETIYY